MRVGEDPLTVAKRELEHLGESDAGVILLRSMLSDAIKTVQDGGDPINTFRDPARNQCIDLAMEDYGGVRNYQKGGVRYSNLGPYSPVLDQLDKLMVKGAEAAKRAAR